MPRNLDIIQSGFRKSGLIGNGVSIGTREQTLGLELLGAFFRSSLTGLFGKLTDVYVTTSPYTAHEGERITKGVPVVAVTFPLTVVDADTGQTRAPKDGAVIVVVDPTTGVPDARMWDAWTGSWQSLIMDTTTSLTAYCPMSGRFEQSLSDILSVLILSEGGMPISPARASRAAMARQNIATRYDNRTEKLYY